MDGIVVGRTGEALVRSIKAGDSLSKFFSRTIIGPLLRPLRKKSKGTTESMAITESVWLGAFDNVLVDEIGGGGTNMLCL